MYNKLSVNYINSLPYFRKDELRIKLNRGVAVLDSDEQMKQYIYSYGLMHQAKMEKAFEKVPFSEFANNKFEIIDWGCGQGLATICLFDELKKRNINHRIKRVTLVEPSVAAIERAKIHVSAYLNNNVKIRSVNKYLDNINKNEIVSKNPITIHLFSNILDVNSFNLHLLYKNIVSNLEGCHYMFCVSPLNPNNHRVDSFYEYFGNPETFLNDKQYEYRYKEGGKSCSYNIIVFKSEGEGKNSIWRLFVNKIKLCRISVWWSKRCIKKNLIDMQQNKTQK